MNSGMITLSCGHVYSRASWKQDSSCFYCDSIKKNLCSAICQQQRNHRGFQATKNGKYMIKPLKHKVTIDAIRTNTISI